MQIVDNLFSILPFNYALEYFLLKNPNKVFTHLELYQAFNRHKKCLWSTFNAALRFVRQKNCYHIMVHDQQTIYGSPKIIKKLKEKIKKCDLTDPMTLKLIDAKTLIGKLIRRMKTVLSFKEFCRYVNEYKKIGTTCICDTLSRYFSQYKVRISSRCVYIGNLNAIKKIKKMLNEKHT